MPFTTHGFETENFFTTTEYLSIKPYMEMHFALTYRPTSNKSRTVVSNTDVDYPDVVGASPGLSALLQLHLHSRLNTWLQWTGQRQLQYETRII